MATSGQLAQDTTAAAAAEVLYTLAASTRASSLVLTVCNNNGTADTFSVYQDDAGGTPGAVGTEIYKDNAILANQTLRLTLGTIDTSGAEIAVESAALNGCTFTLHGVETKI